jgi:zinc protease
MTREDVVEFHARTYLAGCATLVVVGDVEPRATISAIAAAFAEWTGPAPPLTPAYPPVTIERRRRMELVSLRGAAQSEVRFTCPSVARKHPDQFAIQLANAIVGGGPDSRLARALVGTPGVADRVESEFRSQRDAGQYVVGLSTRTGDLRRAIDSTLAVLRKLRDEGPTEDELAAARLALTRAIPPDPQTPGAIAAQVLDLEFFGPPAVDASVTAERLRAVTLADCRRVLKSYFCVDDLAILVVTDPDAGRTALDGLGPLMVQEPR